MENILKLIDKKKEDYNWLISETEHERKTAKKLGFDAEFDAKTITKQWCKDVIHILDEIKSEIEKESKS